MSDSSNAKRLAQEIAAAYAAIPSVEAVTLGGSQTTGYAGTDSDLDLYVYSRSPVPVAERGRIAATRAPDAEVDNRFWEPGDEWIEPDTRIGVDVMFREVAWIEDQLARVLERHEASVGYSTSFWHNVLTAQLLYDRDGWYARLQAWANQPYPEALRQAILAKNHPILRSTHSSYLHQIERAVARNDLVSVNHRVAALLASYFDVIFAYNRLPHPGEKRLLTHAAASPHVPPNMAAQVTALLRAAGDGHEIARRVHDLLDELDALVDESSSYSAA